jgi:hypothetical protein
MKKLLLIGLVAGVLAFVPAQRSDAQVYFSIGFGGPGYYGYYPHGYYYPYRYSYRPYRYSGYYRPYYGYRGHRYYRHHRHYPYRYRYYR